MVDKSSIPVNHGFPNPMFGSMSALISMQPELKSLVALVQRNEGETLDSTLQSLADTDFERRLKVVFDSIKNQKKSEPVIGPPPRPSCLYGRFARGTNIFDVGSGNCSKLVPFSGVLKITANDLEGVMPKLGHVVIKAVGSLEMHLPQPRLFFTGFMSLCTIKPALVDYLNNQDGLFVIPFHDRLIEQGSAFRDGEIVEVRAPNRIYRDNYIALPGLEIETGYKLVATYSEESFFVDMGSETKKESYVALIDASPSGIDDINLDDVSWKYDGIPYELELKGGVAMVTSRNGHVQLGTTDFDGHVCLHFEHVLGHGFVLIRVVCFRGMIPPHCIDSLQLFCQKKKFRLNFAGENFSLTAPERWSPGDDAPCPVDGLISRVEERDYYFKPGWTVDLYPDGVDDAVRKLTSKGYRVEVPEVKGGLCEYLLDRSGGLVRVTYLKERLDKETATTSDTVLYLVERKTLAEMEFLDGTKWKGA